jgi:hypothetical protein
MKLQKHAGLLFAPLVLLLPLATIGCAEHHYYRAYDPYYNDYHRWDDHERVYYQQWVVENHPHRDYRKLDKDDQKRYWEWRRNHGDHDRDRDRDHDRDHDRH